MEGCEFRDFDYRYCSGHAAGCATVERLHSIHHVLWGTIDSENGWIKQLIRIQWMFWNAGGVISPLSSRAVRSDGMGNADPSVIMRPFRSEGG
jgi:hypothetical protein